MLPRSLRDRGLRQISEPDRPQPRSSGAASLSATIPDRKQNMGLFDRLRQELVDIVEWVDDSRHTLVWRFPRFRNEIKNGAQLIVRPGQMAIFVHRGELADVFEPGHYTLSTDNLPLLSTLQGWKYGFESPFKAEIYFVSTRQITDLKWGTPNPIMLRDPDFGPVRLRAFGTYALRASDPAALLREIVGTDSSLEADEVAELMRSIIVSSMADMLGESKIAALDLASNYHELSEELRKTALQRVDDEYGLDVPQLFIVNISLPEEVEKAIDTRSSMGAIGDMQAYQQYQMGRAMLEAAENPSGGGASEGLGLGVGLAMANRMGLPGGAAPPVPGAATGAMPMPPPPPVWYVAENGQSAGPFTANQLTQAVQGGRIQSDTLVWAPHVGSWTAAKDVPDLAMIFGPPSPPPLPQ